MPPRTLRCLMWLTATAITVAALPAAATVTTVGCANVNVSCTLAELVGGSTIQVDDKLFNSFQIEVDPGTINYTLIDVVGRPGTLPGLRFVGIALIGAVTIAGVASNLSRIESRVMYRPDPSDQFSSVA